MAHRCIWTSLFLCVTGSVCSGPWKSQSPPLSWSDLLRLTPPRLPTTTSPRETAVSSGCPGYTVNPCWDPLTRCLARLTACYETRRPGGVGQGVVAMPTTVAVGAMGSWWGWPVSWAPVRSRTSVTVFTSWLDRAGRRTPPPWIRTVLTAMAKHGNTPFPGDKTEMLDSIGCRKMDDRRTPTSKLQISGGSKGRISQNKNKKL